MSSNHFSIAALTQVLEDAYEGDLPASVLAIMREAFEAYQGQFRATRNPNQRIPFIAHPVGTARLALRHMADVEGLEDRETIVAVALAHDLLEDTRIDLSRLEEIAGSGVREYVEALTKPSADAEGRTREDRNELLVRQIIAGGRTAAFVKICDSMHNLTRPQTTPAPLLSKLISKADKYYRPLACEVNLGPHLLDAYDETIRMAKQCLSEDEKHARPAEPIKSLLEAVSEVARASTGKILELHDIVEIVTSLCTPAGITLWRATGEQDQTLIPVKELSSSSLGSLALPGLSERPSEISVKRLKQETGEPVYSGLEGGQVLSVPLRLDINKVFVITIAFSKNTRPDWLTVDAADMLVQYLARRLVLAETDRKAGLASAAASTGLQLDIDLATSLDVQPTDIKNLYVWRLRCQQAIATVQHHINQTLIRYGSKIPFSDSVHTETRLKSVDSILRKYTPPTQRSWPDFESLEDIAGVRIVAPTQATLLALEPLIYNEVESTIRLHQNIVNPRRDYIQAPTKSGYRGLHIVLEVETQIESAKKIFVPCELQLRTVFQDCWARISHVTLYRASRNERRRRGEILRAMAETLEDCERDAENLLGGSNS